jgi:hypothetical protein
MQNYNNVSGTKTVLAVDSGGIVVRQAITGIFPSHNGSLSYGDSDTLILTYPPEEQERARYIVYFVTPNDGINHSYTFNAEFHIPAGPTHQEVFINVYQIFYFHAGTWVALHSNPFWFTLSAPDDWYSGSYTHTFAPDTAVQISLPIYFGINLPGVSDSCPYTCALGVSCNNPILEDNNIIQMIL